MAKVARAFREGCACESYDIPKGDFMIWHREKLKDKLRESGEWMSLWRMPKKRLQKYKAKRCTCKDGHIHASRQEARDCEKVALLERAGEYTEVRTQVSFPLFADSPKGKVKVCTHIVDKLVTRKDGTKEVIETKGFATDTWALKKKLFEANYPEIIYTVWRRGRA